MPNNLLQLRIPEQYIKTLAEDSDSVRYRNSKSEPQLGFWDKVKIFLFPSHYYTELYQFYPFHHVIKQSKEQYDNDYKSSVKNGAYLSFGLWYESIYIAYLFINLEEEVSLPQSSTDIVDC